MTLLPDLQEAADNRLSALGGLEYAQQYFSEVGLAEISLFYGFTLVLTPFTSPVTTIVFKDVGGGRLEEREETKILPVPATDFTRLGYIPGTVFTVLTTQYEVLFETVLESTTVNGAKQYIWGLRTEEQEFVQSRRHAERLFGLVQTSAGSRLMQIIICQTRHPLDIQEEIAEIKRVIKNESLSEDYHELLLDLPSEAGEYKLYIKEAGPRPNLDIVSLQRDPEAIVLTKLPGETVFVKPERDFWFACAETKQPFEQDQVFYNSLKGQERDSVLDQLEQFGFVLTSAPGDSTQYGLELRRTQGFTELMSLYIINTTVDRVEVTAFKTLKLQEVTGEETWRLKQTATANYMQIARSESTLTRINYKQLGNSRLLQAVSTPKKTKLRGQFG
jgi:hypothetical protein